MQDDHREELNGEGAGPQPEPSAPEPSRSQSATPHPLEAPEQALGPDERDESAIPTRWERLRGNTTLIKVAAVSSFLVVGGGVALLALRQNEGAKQVSATNPNSFLDFVDTIAKDVTRKSPETHTVKSHTRKQHYGAGRAETKTVNISPYSRGSSS